VKRSTRNLIDTRIAEVLRDNALFEPPIDLNVIAKRLDVPIRTEQLPKEISGFLHRQGTAAVIVVNSRHTRARQRFTIAHELGHLILDHKPDQVHVDKSFVIKFRKAAHVVDPEETQANFFAASLLMPAPMLRDDMKAFDHDGVIPDDFLLELTERYGVSMQALIIRLNTLNYTLLMPA